MAIDDRNDIFGRPKIIVEKGNHLFDQNIQGLGFCCPFAFIRMHLEKTHTVPFLAKKAGIGVSTMKRHRMWIRSGKERCRARARCMAGLWLTDHQIRKIHNEVKQEQEEKENGKNP